MFIWNIYWKIRDCWLTGRKKGGGWKVFYPLPKVFYPLYGWKHFEKNEDDAIQGDYQNGWYYLCIPWFIHPYGYIRSLGWDGRSLNIDPKIMSHPDFKNFPCHEIKLSRSEIWNLCRSSRYLYHIKIGRADFDLFFLHLRHFMDTDFDHLIISIIFSFTVRFRIFKNIFKVRYTLNWRSICCVCLCFIYYVWNWKWFWRKYMWGKKLFKSGVKN